MQKETKSMGERKKGRYDKSRMAAYPKCGRSGSKKIKNSGDWKSKSDVQRATCGCRKKKTSEIITGKTPQES